MREGEEEGGREGGRGGREEGRKGGREGGTEREREGGEGEREGGREGERERKGGKDGGRERGRERGREGDREGGMGGCQQFLFSQCLTLGQYLLQTEEVIHDTDSDHCDALLFAENRASSQQKRESYPVPSSRPCNTPFADITSVTQISKTNLEYGMYTQMLSTTCINNRLLCGSRVHLQFCEHH